VLTYRTLIFGGVLAFAAYLLAEVEITVASMHEEVQRAT
jgi:hypothetical protein